MCQGDRGSARGIWGEIKGVWGLGTQQQGETESFRDLDQKEAAAYIEQGAQELGLGAFPHFFYPLHFAVMDQFPLL